MQSDRLRAGNAAELVTSPSGKERDMAIQIINGEDRKVREFHIGKKFTILCYRKCKRAEKRVQIIRDRFFDTGVTVYMFLKF